MKILLTALTVTVLPGLAMAECGYSKMRDTAQSCTQGSVWDAQTQSCVAVTTS